MNDTSKLYGDVDPAIYDPTTLTTNVIFENVAEMLRGKVVLKAHGFTFVIPDYFHCLEDPLSPAVTVTALRPADMSVDDLWQLVTRILEPFDAYLFECGLVVLDEEALWRDPKGDFRFGY